MRGVRAAALLFIALCTSASGAEPSRQYWRLCARADIIVVGTLSLPRDDKEQIATKNGRAEIALRPERVVKGNPPAATTVRYFLGDEPYEVHKEMLLALDGKPAVIFLILGTDGSNQPVLYFEQSTAAVEAAEPSHIAQVDAEIARQNDVLAHWRPNPGLRDFEAAKVLIDKTTAADGATEAFKGLEALGQSGVSAMIAQMDDRRELGVHQMELENPKGFWESFRHYGPEDVVDALDAILNQITGENFGDIENGGSDAERDHTVAGWRIYDDVALQPSGRAQTIVSGSAGIDASRRDSRTFRAVASCS